MRNAGYEDDDFDPRRRRAAEDDREEAPRRSFWRLIAGNSIGDRIAIAACLFVGIGIAVNALARQNGPHPSPMFSTARIEPAVAVPVPPARPAEIQSTASIPARGPELASAQSQPAAAPTAAPRADLVLDVQRELARRNLYDGTVDGKTGPKTEAAIRRYEAQAGLRASGQASEQLLGHMRRPARAAPAAQPQPRQPQAANASPQSIAQLLQSEGRPASAPARAAAPARTAEPQSIAQLLEGTQPAPRPTAQARRTP
ncbi:peptidoglycan-binding protein [Phreatobacter aquaticus]|uniref:Peptidoglycan-binding protein n=1 Tax=Phreatobacter aquaticus TaxID=2570229 RepID=A0A4D7QKT4_9HYPH|nr:peptidoglycan-binding domain-containing protein [Phreatobacter aquaticus]QCK86593.1 peptidoglycan-binding protein [Phreatobacter aquaticus]